MTDVVLGHDHARYAGYSSRKVAELLSVAPSTIKTHMLNLFDTTGRHRREDLVKLANEVSLPA